MSSPFSGWEALLIGGDARAPHADGALAGHERLADGVCVLCDTCIPCLVDKQAWSGLPSFDGPVGELHRASSSHSKKTTGHDIINRSILELAGAERASLLKENRKRKRKG